MDWASTLALPYLLVFLCFQLHHQQSHPFQLHSLIYGSKHFELSLPCFWQRIEASVQEMVNLAQKACPRTPMPIQLSQLLCLGRVELLKDLQVISDIPNSFLTRGFHVLPCSDLAQHLRLKLCHWISRYCWSPTLKNDRIAPHKLQCDLQSQHISMHSTEFCDLPVNDSFLLFEFYFETVWMLPLDLLLLVFLLASKSFTFFSQIVFHSCLWPSCLSHLLGRTFFLNLAASFTNLLEISNPAGWNHVAWGWPP